jgi:hypothetical protein
MRREAGFTSVVVSVRREAVNIGEEELAGTNPIRSQSRAGPCVRTAHRSIHRCSGGSIACERPIDMADGRIAGERKKSGMHLAVRGRPWAQDLRPRGRNL